MTMLAASKQIKTILGEEANALAAWMTDPKNGKLPHRVEISLSREIERLRELARYSEHTPDLSSLQESQ